MVANGNGTARWQLWVSAATVAVMIMGSLMVLYLTANRADQRSADLELRVAKLEETVAQNRSDINVMRADLREADTQLRASIDDRNLAHAWDLRVESMLWEQAFHGKSHLPTDNAVYPNIANGPSR